jgi:hypothetical protein
MRKSDDDLKIDINELFGGDISAARQSVEQSNPVLPEDTESPETQATPPSSPTDIKIAEQQFQEWMTIREKELEAKTQELERRLEELRDHQLQAAQAPVDSLEVPEVSVEESLPANQVVIESPIDFDAPISPPFIPKLSLDELSNPALEELPAPEKETNLTNEGELERVRNEYEFLMIYDEFRGIIIHELKDLVGEKKTYKMLERTVELAREKFPEVFRNANWDASGNLLEDGSLESQRLIENKSSLESTKSKIIFDLALGTLLSLRLQAIEKGLGTGMKNKVRARLYHWINEKIEKEHSTNKNIEDLNRLKNFVV